MNGQSFPHFVYTVQVCVCVFINNNYTAYNIVYKPQHMGAVRDGMTCTVNIVVAHSTIPLNHPIANVAVVNPIRKFADAFSITNMHTKLQLRLRILCT